jgi:hypothetical protein
VTEVCGTLGGLGNVAVLKGWGVVHLADSGHHLGHTYAGVLVGGSNGQH